MSLNVPEIGSCGPNPQATVRDASPSREMPPLESLRRHWVDPAIRAALSQRSAMTPVLVGIEVVMR